MTLDPDGLPPGTAPQWRVGGSGSQTHQFNASVAMTAVRMMARPVFLRETVTATPSISHSTITLMASNVTGARGQTYREMTQTWREARPPRSTNTQVAVIPIMATGPQTDQGPVPLGLESSPPSCL